MGEALEDEDGISCELTVKVSCEHLNEANLSVAQSTLENTGLGLFLLPLRSEAKQKVISAGKNLCTYAYSMDTDKSQPGNYYVDREGVSYDAEVIDGENHGRFANQGSHY